MAEASRGAVVYARRSTSLTPNDVIRLLCEVNEKRVSSAAPIRPRSGEIFIYPQSLLGTAIRSNIWMIPWTHNRNKDLPFLEPFYRKRYFRLRTEHHSDSGDERQFWRMDYSIFDYPKYFAVQYLGDNSLIDEYCTAERARRIVEIQGKLLRWEEKLQSWSKTVSQLETKLETMKTRLDEERSKASEQNVSDGGTSLAVNGNEPRSFKQKSLVSASYRSRIAPRGTLKHARDVRDERQRAVDRVAQLETHFEGLLEALVFLVTHEVSERSEGADLNNATRKVAKYKRKGERETALLDQVMAINIEETDSHDDASKKEKSRKRKRRSTKGDISTEHSTVPSPFPSTSTSNNMDYEFDECSSEVVPCVQHTTVSPLCSKSHECFTVPPTHDATVSLPVGRKSHPSPTLRPLDSCVSSPRCSKNLMDTTFLTETPSDSTVPLPDSPVSGADSNRDIPETVINPFPFALLPDGLPQIIMGHALRTLSTKDLLRATRVCKFFLHEIAGKITEIRQSDFARPLLGSCSCKIKRQHMRSPDGSGIHEKAYDEAVLSAEQFHGFLLRSGNDLRRLELPLLFVSISIEKSWWKRPPLVLNNLEELNMIMCTHSTKSGLPLIAAKTPNLTCARIHIETKEYCSLGFPLRHWKKLTRLAFSGMKMCSDRQRKAFKDFLLTLSGLTSVDLRDSLAYQQHFNAISYKFEQSLVELRADCGSKVARPAGSPLLGRLDLCSNVTTLDLGAIYGIDAALDQMRALHGLNHLHLRESRFSTSALVRLFSDPNVSLKRVSLSRVNVLDTEVLNALLRNNHLEVLCLSLDPETANHGSNRVEQILHTLLYLNMHTLSCLQIVCQYVIPPLPKDLKRSFTRSGLHRLKCAAIYHLPNKEHHNRFLIGWIRAGNRLRVVESSGWLPSKIDLDRGIVALSEEVNNSEPRADSILNVDLNSYESCCFIGK